VQAGAPFVLKGGKRYEVYLDDETIEILKKINPNRSEAIRILAKQFKKNSL
jgi:hypothetical protein